MIFPRLLAQNCPKAFVSELPRSKNLSKDDLTLKRGKSHHRFKNVSSRPASRLSPPKASIFSTFSCHFRLFFRLRAKKKISLASASPLEELSQISKPASLSKKEFHFLIRAIPPSSFKRPLFVTLYFLLKIIRKLLFFSRLNQDRHGGAWCPKPAISENVKEWLQVDLNHGHIITGIITQVRKLHLIILNCHIGPVSQWFFVIIVSWRWISTARTVIRVFVVTTRTLAVF